MSTTQETLQYPIVRDVGLTVDPIYKELQKRGPVKVKMPFGEECWLATRYEDVRTVYGDRRFSREMAIGRDVPRVRPGAMTGGATSMTNMDPPDHTRLRRLTSKAFTPQRIAQLRGRIQELVDGLLDGMVEHGAPADFVDMFAWQLPITVIAELLGVPEKGRSDFRHWGDTTMSTQSTFEQAMGAMQNLNRYIAALVADRRVNRTDDLLGVLVEARDDHDKLTEEELVSFGVTLLLAGFETTANQLGTTVYTLLANPGHWQELLDDSDLLPAAMEELWRFIPSFDYGNPLPRYASEDVELSGGVIVRAGEAVLPEHAVANRDESVFPNGWEMDFHRVDPKPHLSLAHGAHHCMGAQLAHLELEVTVETLLRRFPSLKIAIPDSEIRWSPTTPMRSVVELPLAW